MERHIEAQHQVCSLNSGEKNKNKIIMKKKIQEQL